MKVFISYHRADTAYSRKLERILQNYGIDYYAVPEDADFNGKKAETIRNFLCNKLNKCDVLICLIGKDTYSRPHVDREIHTALKGAIGTRLGIVGVHLPTRTDALNSIDLNTFPIKLWESREYVVWSDWNRVNSSIESLIEEAYQRSYNNKYQTNHKNPCMPLRTTLYYDN